MYRTDDLQKALKAYLNAGMPDTYQTKDVARWALDHGYLEPRPVDIVSECAEAFARMLREEYRTTPNGRRYRAKHAVRYAQHTLWADIDNAPRGHMENAFAQRRKQIIGDCHQLKMDVDYYNEKNPKESAIQFVLDFTADIQEIEVLEGLAQSAA